MLFEQYKAERDGETPPTDPNPTAWPGRGHMNRDNAVYVRDREPGRVSRTLNRHYFNSFQPLANTSHNPPRIRGAAGRDTAWTLRGEQLHWPSLGRANKCYHDKTIAHTPLSMRRAVAEAGSKEKTYTCGTIKRATTRAALLTRFCMQRRGLTSICMSHVHAAEARPRYAWRSADGSADYHRRAASTATQGGRLDEAATRITNSGSDLCRSTVALGDQFAVWMSRAKSSLPPDLASPDKSDADTLAAWKLLQAYPDALQTMSKYTDDLLNKIKSYEAVVGSTQSVRQDGGRVSGPCELTRQNVTKGPVHCEGIFSCGPNFCGPMLRSVEINAKNWSAFANLVSAAAKRSRTIDSTISTTSATTEAST